MKCTQCDFENDSTRIFCQNCGTRLPVAAPAAGKLFVPPAEKISPVARKPVKPAPIPASRTIGKSGGPRLLRSLVFTIVFAAFLAAVIQMARSPDAVPAAQTVNEGAATEFFQTIKTMVASPYPRTSQVTQSQVNNYLANTIIAAPDDGRAIQAKFSRAFVTLGKGDYRFFVEEKVLKWPVYLYLIQQPISVGGNMTVKTTGGGIGRMPFDPLLLSVVAHFVNPVIDALTEPADVLQKATAVTVTPGQATLTWPGTPTR